MDFSSLGGGGGSPMSGGGGAGVVSSGATSGVSFGDAGGSSSTPAWLGLVVVGVLALVGMVVLLQR